MLKNDRSELDYGRLVKLARQLPQSGGGAVKVAVLADVSTQHLVPVLRALFASNGTDVEIYEGGYDTIEIEAFDPDSKLYEFGPRLVVILQSTVKLKAAWYDYPGDRQGFGEAKASRIEEVWSTILERTQAQIIQSTFVLPYERPFGHFGHKVSDTLQGMVSELNREIVLRARKVPNVLIHDVDQLASWVGRRHFFDEKLWALSKSICAFEFLPELAQNIVDIGLAAIGRSVKCVVLDLDNTLWGGVVGDDGLDGIALGDLDDGHAFRFFQLYLLELSRRGILLAVCSKNDEANARRVFREHPGMVLKEEHIAVFIANWEDKATNIRRIRETLNIGFDSMVFLDDNPFERNLVRQLVPDIVVPELPEDPGLYVRTICELNLFETASHSALDGRRSELYKDQAKRDEEKGRFTSLSDYLKSLETTAIFTRFEPQNLSRIAQLISRSNQFNLTTKRYSEAECEAMMRDEANYFPFSITVQDRFGDFGLINVVVLHRRDARVLEIDTFLMSCRVLQRGVEQYAMNRVFEYARQGGFERVVGRYIPTAKNSMVKDFYARFGFEQVQSDHAGGTAEGTEWALAVDAYLPKEVFIRDFQRSEAVPAPRERDS